MKSELKDNETVPQIDLLRLPIGNTPVWGPLRKITPAARLNKLLATTETINGGVPPGCPIGLEDKLYQRKPMVLPLEIAAVRNPLVANLRFLHVVGHEHGRRRNRPPSELAAKHLWEREAAGPLVQTDLLEAVRLLGGEPRLRPGRMFTSKFESGHYFEFVPRDQVEPRLDRLLRRLNRSEPNIHPLLHAVGIFFETTLIHPLSDGNGRLARLLFQLDLQRTIGLKAPILPLGPACAANRPALVAAFLAWEFDRNAQPMVDFITAAFEQLVALYGGNATP